MSYLQDLLHIAQVESGPPPMHDDSLSSLPERWVELFGFPGYTLSDRGQVVNTRTGVCLRSHLNTRGAAIIGLMQNGIQHKRSLSLLVATHFVTRPGNMSFDTPINLDGNLTWRPLWFARKYHVQFNDDHPTCNVPVEDVETHETYESSMHASIHNGVLDIDIYLSMANNTYVWPTGQIFRIVI
jgi:hypothetical protein